MVALATLAGPDPTLAAADSLDSITTTPIRPASHVVVKDTPNDGGESIDITWELSPDDHAEGLVKAYSIARAESVNGAPGLITGLAMLPAGTTKYQDGQVVEGKEYFYTVRTISDSSAATLGKVWMLESAPVGPVKATAQWFDWRRINVFVGTVMLCGFIILYIMLAQAGKTFFIRKIAGLEAVDEAVGRATEMGRKVYYIPGSQDMDQVATLAGITILGRVAEKAAQYETRLDVPVARSLVMVTCREVVKEAYVRSGRPDSFREDQVTYLTDDQFGYAAAIDGLVVREKPAAIFMMGMFYAESLILAETGNSVGAIQIAGTSEPSQLPFFVAACDYTLIGEELFAASAYLSKEPRQLGSLKGQDIGKGVILAAIVIGILLETLHLANAARLFQVIE
ncbi:MAG: DUF6754 domain-containing protein [Candidatus Zixiibacteriota bacterium]